MLWFILAIVQVGDDGQTSGQEKGRQKQQQQQQPSSFCDIDLLQSHCLGHDCVAVSAALSPVPTPINKINDSSIMMVAQQKQQEEQEQEEQSVNDK